MLLALPIVGVKGVVFRFVVQVVVAEAVFETWDYGLEVFDMVELIA
jgi:hypothetical protein